MSSVQNRIKSLRQDLNITQEELGRAVGVSRQTIISIERGRYIPSLALALKLARYFGCSTDDIFVLEN